MADYNILTDINGNKFNMGIADDMYVSVLKAGYIITPDGYFVPVNDKVDHNDVFSQYLYNYYGKKELKYYESTEGAYELCGLGHVVYYGIRPQDFKNGVITNNGFGVTFLPSPLSGLTNKQKEALKKLIDSNTSIFRTDKIIDLQFGDIITGQEYNEEYIRELINDSPKIQV